MIVAFFKLLFIFSMTWARFVVQSHLIFILAARRISIRRGRGAETLRFAWCQTSKEKSTDFHFTAWHKWDLLRRWLQFDRIIMFCNHFHDSFKYFRVYILKYACYWYMFWLKRDQTLKAWGKQGSFETTCFCIICFEPSILTSPTVPLFYCLFCFICLWYLLTWYILLQIGNVPFSHHCFLCYVLRFSNDRNSFQ